MVRVPFIVFPLVETLRAIKAAEKSGGARVGMKPLADDPQLRGLPGAFIWELSIGMHHDTRPLTTPNAELAG